MRHLELSGQKTCRYYCVTVPTALRKKHKLGLTGIILKVNTTNNSASKLLCSQGSLSAPLRISRRKLKNKRTDMLIFKLPAALTRNCTLKTAGNEVCSENAVRGHLYHGTEKGIGFILTWFPLVVAVDVLVICGRGRDVPVEGRRGLPRTVPGLGSSCERQAETKRHANIL